MLTAIFLQLDLVLIENISDGFTFISSSGCDYKNNVLTISANLYRAESIDCKYDLMTKESGNYRLTSNIMFFWMVTLQEIKKENNIKVKEYGLNIIVDKLPKENFDINENIKFNFNLSNDFPDDINIKNIELRPKLFKINEENIKGILICLVIQAGNFLLMGIFLDMVIILSYILYILCLGDHIISRKYKI